MKKSHRVYQGDTFAILVPLYVDGVLTPVAGWEFWFTVKAAPTDADVDAIVQKSTAGGSILGDTLTSVVVRGAPADTKGKAAARYDYDIQGKSPDGEIHTLEVGFFFIDSEITVTS